MRSGLNRQEIEVQDATITAERKGGGSWKNLLVSM